MLLDYGHTLVDHDWKVVEQISPGFSRIYYIYGGEVEYSDPASNIRLKKGCLYIFPSAAPYQITQNPENRLYCTFFHVDMFPALITELIEIPVENNKLLKNILSALTESIDLKERSLVHSLTEIIKTYCKEHSIIPYPDHRISKVLLYISEHYSEDLSVRKISQLFGYNDQYFIRYFKRVVGVSPYQYISGYRLKEAKLLLRTDIPITQIAKLTGYKDIKSFSRAFKLNFGMSPSEFKSTFKVQP